MSYDFNAPIDNTSTELAKLILKKLAENCDILIYPNQEEPKNEEDRTAYKAEEARREEVQTDFAISLLKEIGQTDIPADYATYFIDSKIYPVLTTLKKYIDGTVSQAQHEILSRYIGTRSPETDKFRKDCATFGELLTKVDEIRKQTGGDLKDYFS